MRPHQNDSPWPTWQPALLEHHVVVEWGPMRDAAPSAAVETMDAPLLPQIAKGSPSSAKGFCSNCGTKRDPDAKFCHGCGERL
mmetsp:Transcript_4679/g.10239  ORF Transcript_4679/g.10239 Transcript_4679/m.10239 type:complete len:83 (+) Transcript_4679:903-1151(+)